MTISGYSYSPLTVKAGETITVKNQDSMAHTVTSAAGGFDVPVPPNGQATLKAPTKPGSYALTCNYHPQMHGTLTVT